MKSIFEGEYMTLCCRMLVIVLFALTSVFAVSKPYSGTPAKTFRDTVDGTYIIHNAEELMLFAKVVNDSIVDDSYLLKNSFNAELADDIVFNEGDATEWGKKAPKYTWKTIGDKVSSKNIYFDGKGHSISGIFVNNGLNNQGFIGYFLGRVSNLTIKNSFVKGDSCVGAVAGYVSRGEIENVKVENVVVQGVGNVGGVVGYTQWPHLTNVSFDGSVKGGLNVGGVVGSLTTAKKVIGDKDTISFKNIHNYADVVGRTNVGGVIGIMSKAVVHDFRYVANHGNVDGDSLAGGIIGFWSDSEYLKSIPSYIRNTGNVSGVYFTAGLIGSNMYADRFSVYVSLNYAYNAGNVSGVVNVDPLYGKNDYFRYYDADVYNMGGVTAGDSVIATQVAVKDLQVYLDSLGPDFAPDTGAVLFGDGYPIFLHENPDFHYLNGSGTASDPFVIESERDFIVFGRHAGAFVYKDNYYYRQAADIKFTSKDHWKPIFMNDVVYDGEGHKISDFVVNDSVGGVFGFVDSSATIKNLFLENVDITARTFAAALAGGLSEKALVENIKVSGSVKSLFGSAAGIVGQAGSSSKFKNCENLADVDAAGHYAGGIFATCSRMYYSRPYESSFFTTTINGVNLTFEKVVNRGNISGNSCVGGVVGEANGIVFDAENYGTVTGKYYVGGVAGTVWELRSALNRGPISAQDTAGGVAAMARNAANVYNAADITVDRATCVGQIIGLDTYNSPYLHKNGIVIHNAYYEKGVNDYKAIGFLSKFLDVADTAGAVTKEFKSESFAKKMGNFFKFDKNDENDGYPLMVEPFNGAGIEDEPFLLQNEDDLLLFNEILSDTAYIDFYADKHYKLTTDLEFDSLVWTPAASCVVDSEAYVKYRTQGFSGVFDGGGHTVSGLVIKSDTAGFFGFAHKATIKNFGIKNSSVQGTVAGGIVGSMSGGLIENCWNDNTSVYGESFAGGLVGGGGSRWKDNIAANGSLIINRTYNTGTVRGQYKVGGIIGFKGYSGIRSIENTFNRGVVENVGLIDGSCELGGITGESFTGFVNVYNVGEVRGYRGTSYTLSPSDYYNLVGDNVARLREDENDPFGLTAKEMRSKEFAERMGEAFAYDEKNQNDGYPILSGKDVKPSSVAIPRKEIVKVNSSLKVAASMRNVFVSGLVPGESLSVVNMKGQKIWLGRATGPSQVIPLQNAGVYMLLTKSKIVKVLVK